MSDFDGTTEGRDDTDDGDGDGEPADGRSLRRERNVNRVLDAVIELASEGVLDPTLDQISERAHVSPRSVHRYFPDRPALVRSAIERSTSRVTPLLEMTDPGRGPLDQRIAEFVAARASTFWEFEAVGRTVYANTTDAVLARGVAETRRGLREQLSRQFWPELAMLNHGARSHLILVLDVAFQFESLVYFVDSGELDAEGLVAVLERHLHAHLDPLVEQGAAD